MISVSYHHSVIYCNSWLPSCLAQVVQIAVYTFVLSLLFARQFVQPNDDYLLVLFTLLKILFYMGWIKVRRPRLPFLSISLLVYLYLHIFVPSYV